MPPADPLLPHKFKGDGDCCEWIVSLAIINGKYDIRCARPRAAHVAAQAEPVVFDESRVDEIRERVGLPPLAPPTAEDEAMRVAREWLAGFEALGEYEGPEDALLAGRIRQLLAERDAAIEREHYAKGSFEINLKGRQEAEAEAARLREERDALEVERRQRNDAALSALRYLTPGGSEFQTVEECVTYVRATMRGQHERLVLSVEARRKAEADRDALREERDNWERVAQVNEDCATQRLADLSALREAARGVVVGKSQPIVALAARRATHYQDREEAGEAEAALVKLRAALGDEKKPHNRDLDEALNSGDGSYKP